MARSQEYGIFDSEFAAFQGRRIRGRSVIVDAEGGYSANADLSPSPHEYMQLCYNGGVGREKFLVEIDTGLYLRGDLGPTPVLLLAYLALARRNTTPGTTGTVQAWRVPPETAWDIATATYQYRDGPPDNIDWYGNAWSPVPGQDVDAEPYASVAYSNPDGLPSTVPDHLFPVTDQLAEALLGNHGLRLMLATPYPTSGAAGGLALAWDETGPPRARLQYWFLYPVEFFKADQATKEILLAELAGTSGSARYYLGAVQRGETGVPVLGYLRNFSDQTIPHLEVLDDHPEWFAPRKTVGTGAPELDYVALQDAAVSQKYTFIFKSPTTYWVKAEGRSNYPLDLNLTDVPAWNGDTATPFNPGFGSGLVVPAEAWQPGTVATDEIEVLVEGNTTLPEWPADSNDQCEITRDVAGTPDAAGWRKTPGRRTLSTATVAVSGAVHKFPVRRIDTSEWEVGSPAFVANEADINEGNVQSVQDREVGTPSHAGPGSDDLALSGNYNGATDYLAAEDSEVVVRILAAGSPDTYEVSFDGGDDHGRTWDDNGGAGYDLDTSPVALPTEPSVLAEWTSDTGHTAWVAAEGTITVAGLPVADETFVIGGNTYTFKASRSAPFEVTIGASAAETVTNIVYAITQDDTEVTAVDGVGDTVVVTLVVKGTAGDSVVFTESATNVTMDGGGTLGGTTAGVDGDQWSFDLQTWSVTLENLSGSATYPAGARVATTLPFRDLAASVWGQTSAASGASESPANRLWIDGPSGLGFAPGDDVHVEALGAVGAQGDYETAVIAAGGVQSEYLTFEANLENDYPAGSLALKVGSGEAGFWMRAVAEEGTEEELKQLRLALRQ